MTAAAHIGVAVAVGMGPRNKRRLAFATILIGVVAAAAAAAFLLLPSNHPGGTGSSHAPTRAAAPTFVTSKLVYGMNKSEVARRVGRPTKTVGPCWQYDENEKIRDGQNVLNAERVCFLSGIYSYDYSEIDGKWDYPTNPINLPHPVG